MNNRFEQTCLYELAELLNKPLQRDVSVDYSGKSGSFSKLIQKSNNKINELYGMQGPVQGQASYLRRGLNRLKNKFKRMGLLSEKPPSVDLNNPVDVYSLFVYTMFSSVYATWAENEGWKENKCDKEKALLEQLLALTENKVPYNYMPQYLFTRLFSHKNYSSLSLEGPSLELGISDGATSNFVWGERKLSVGSDPLVGTLSNSKQYNNYKQYVCIDSTSIPYQDNTFKTVVSMNSIYHTEDKVRAIKEVARVCAPGGIVSFDDICESMPKLRPIPNLLKSFGMKKTMASLLDFWFKSQQYFTPQQYTDMLTELGFDEIEITPFMSEPVTALGYLLFDMDYLFMQEKFMLNAKTKRYFVDVLRDVVPQLLFLDEKMCRQDNLSSYFRITAKKAGEACPVKEDEIINRMICPVCGQGLLNKNELVECIGCATKYPVIDGVLLLMPVYAKHYPQLVVAG